MDEAIDLRIERVIDENDTSSNSFSDSRGDSSGENSNAGSRRSSEINVSYDLTLPALHSYLGNDLEELSGRTVLDDDSVQTIPIVTLPGILLVPGQTLPLQLNNPSTISMIKNIIRNDRTFGLINTRFSGRGFSNTLDPIGTTVEVRSFHEESFNSGMMLKVKAEGRQRFHLIHTHRQIDGIMLAKVRILPELFLEEPSIGSRLLSLDKFKFPPPKKQQETKPKECPSGYLPRETHKQNKFDYAHCTPFPSFVYKQFDAKILMEKILQELRSWNRNLKSENLPTNPKDFSYYVTSSLPIDDNQRLSLLSCDEVTQRLRQILEILKTCSVLCCRDCSNVVAKTEDIFSMSQHGPQGAYVNKNGYVHEAITFYKAKGMLMLGRPSTEQSWFPGYAWTILECRQCHSHMGWLFTAHDKKLKPLNFWALCRSAIQTRLANSEGTNSTHINSFQQAYFNFLASREPTIIIAED